MTEERNNAIASLKEELAKNNESSYKFKIQGHPDKEYVLFYNGKKVYTADDRHDLKAFVFDVFDHSPSVVGKWDFGSYKNAELAEKSETELLFFKDDLRIDADNIQEIVKECKHESVFNLYPFDGNEETDCSRETYEMWHCERIFPSNVAFPVADLEMEIVVPTFISAFEKAGIRFGKRTQDLLEEMIDRCIPFNLTISHKGFNITILDTMD